MPGAKTRRAGHTAALFALAILLSVFFWRPAFWAYPSTQSGDGQRAHKLLEAARISVVRYHELPLWNPYECGGVPLWDNPPSFVAAPLAWPTLLIGTTHTIVLWYLLHTAAGFLGMWLLTRHDLGLSRGASLVASVAWAYSGFHQHHYAGGHVAFAPFEFLPLALFMWRRAENDIRYAVGVGALLATMMYEGAVYPIPHFVLVLAAESLTRAWPKDRLVKLVKLGAVVGIVAFALGAARFLPVIDQLRHHKPVLEPETDRVRLATLKDMFLARSHPFHFPQQKYHWNEYGGYVGPILLFLATVGVFIADSSMAWLVMLLALCASLMMGHLSRFAPWHLLTRFVFPFKEMRVPSRFVAEVDMLIAAFVGVAIDRVPRLVGERFPNKAWAGQLRIGVLALGLIGVGDVMSLGTSFIQDFGFHDAAETHPAAEPRLTLGAEGMASLINEPQQNRGRIQCWDDWAFNIGAPLWEGDVPQANPVDDGATVLSVSRTQNTFTLDVDVTRTSVIKLNTSYDRGFRTSVGKTLRYQKLLAIELPPGEHHVVVKYWPFGLTFGLLTSGFSLVFLAGFFVWDRRRRKTRESMVPP
jgi:hypothetical protein